ncbi:MAG TPA: hypothetical protein EYP19_14205 [Desulfobacterales bacterium]|nr:hypothetical protein [Desulfobacterales bacterium]
MSAGWLAIQSFQQSQDILAAINAVSIHTKLRLTGVADEERAPVVAKARETLASFLDAFEKVIHQTEQAKDGPLIGIDPRLRQLARSFIAARHNRRRFHSALFTKSISDMAGLLASNDKKDQQALVECLVELRILVEEHIHVDANRILGEI